MRVISLRSPSNTTANASRKKMTFQGMAMGLGWRYRQVVSAGCVRELTRRLRRLRYLVVVSETVVV